MGEPHESSRLRLPMHVLRSVDQVSSMHDSALIASVLLADISRRTWGIIQLSFLVVLALHEAFGASNCCS